MKSLKHIFWIYLLLLSGLWWFTDQTTWASLDNFFRWRALWMQYSGVLGIGIMSLAMLLAIRPVMLESYLGGLDKMYRLHKWLGISGLVIALSHWLMAQVPKWLVGWGWLERPVRLPRPALPEGSIQQFFLNQRHLAESIGEWAFYGALVLMVLALIKWFPYRWFFKTHRVIAVTYLALVWHSVVLIKFDYWSGVLGPVMAVLMATGSVAAILVLFRRVATSRQVVGEVASIHRHDALQVLALNIQLKGHWPGHESGQFAFLTLHEDEGPHPFTITSAWTGDGHIQFIIKALGDYTRTLADRLQVGDPVKVEGPYGRFNFQGKQPRQIWVGGGIGITPFIARLQTLTQIPDGKAINLFHTTTVYDAEAIGLLERDAQAANVPLHVLWDKRDGQLNAEQICKLVPDWRDADVWFCGPAGFGQALKRDLTAMGLPKARFHQELFALR
ncbi:MAG: ferric reductase-like transmembrane domain-containing protein [Phycisphaerales bacterium]|nr:ferric reductase-like transmembrane domain-containing protein [Phycisphaerales bacterium]